MALLTRYLQGEGFEVTGRHDGAEGLHAALEGAYDVILLDLNLPTMSGIEVFKAVRKQSDVPIVMVTARDDAVDRIVGLELGADDYITKPFVPREVVARVKNIVGRRRRCDVECQVLHEVQRVGEIEFNRTGHEVRVNGEQIYLTPTEFRILDVLLRNAGRALTRAQILDTVTHDSNDIYDRTLDKHIGNLRQKLGETSNQPRYIMTIHGVGYKVRN